MTAKQIFYKVRPFLGLIIMVLLFLICSIVVFFSVFSILVLPLLWMIFTVLHQLKAKNKKVTYLWNATRFSMWIYFSTLFLSLLYTPEWMKVLSIHLERKSLFNVFKEGTYMYGRASLAFLLSAFVFAAFLLHYRWSKKLAKTDKKSLPNTTDSSKA